MLPLLIPQLDGNLATQFPRLPMLFYILCLSNNFIWRDNSLVNFFILRKLCSGKTGGLGFNQQR